MSDRQGQRCAVVGSPILHSLSPVMHRAAYAELGLDWSYEAVEVAEGDLRGFVDTLARPWRALSVTAPLKREALALATHVDPVAAAVQVANTLVFDDGARRAYNTDVPGALAALIERGVGPVHQAVLLGGGATAASMVHALARLGAARVVVVVRDVARATLVVDAAAATGLSLTVSTFDDPPVASDLCIATLPGHQQPAVCREWAARAAAVFDVAYDPWPSQLLRHELSSEQIHVSGVDLLAHQAVLQVELMTGRAVPVDTMRVAALTAIGALG